MTEVVLARLDVLGFTNLATSRNDVYRLLKEEVERIDSRLNYVRHTLPVPRIVLRGLYGDTIDMYFDSGDDDSALSTILVEVVAGVQMDLLEKGVLVRGAIVKGDLIHEGDVFTGDAMVEAHKLEKGANGPLVMVSSEIVDLVSEDLETRFTNPTDRQKQLSRYFSSDSACWINYVGLTCPDGGYDNHIWRHKRMLVSTIESYRSLPNGHDDKHRENGLLAGAKRYHNSICRDNGQMIECGEDGSNQGDRSGAQPRERSTGDPNPISYPCDGSRFSDDVSSESPVEPGCHGFIERFQSPSGVGIHIIENLGPFRMKPVLGFDVIRNEDGTVYLRNREAELFGLGDTLADAEEDLLSELEFAWERYVLSDEDGLHESARMYRKWLLDHIERSEE